jgi:branched-chain amino acid transport system substrate-binding protein
MHAPITGAAPLPTQEVERGKDLFFRWMEKNGRRINGRRVEVILKNDNYNPAQAVEACKELVEEEHVFALVGLTGPGQISACARYAHHHGVPYLSPGSVTKGMALDSVFATTMTYKRQSVMLVDHLISDLGAKTDKNGIVWQGPFYDEAHTAFVKELENRNAEVTYDRHIPITAGASDAQSVAAEMKIAGVDNAYVLVTPTFFIQLAQAAQNSGYHPLWTGSGPQAEADTVANIACRNQNSIQGAHFLSPYPAFVDRDDYSPAYDKAIKTFKEGSGSTVSWWSWAQQKVLAKLLGLPGRNLTRQRFLYFTERARVTTGIGPRLDYAPNDHFGAEETHVVKADCKNNRWRTIRSFVTDF